MMFGNDGKLFVRVLKNIFPYDIYLSSSIHKYDIEFILEPFSYYIIAYFCKLIKIYKYIEIGHSLQ